MMKIFKIKDKKIKTDDNNTISDNAVKSKGEKVMGITYTKNSQEMDGDELIQEILDGASDSTYLNILGEPPVAEPDVIINKTKLGQILVTVAQAIREKCSVNCIVKKIRDDHAVLIKHSEVRKYVRMIKAEYAERFLSGE